MPSPRTAIRARPSCRRSRGDEPSSQCHGAASRSGPSLSMEGVSGGRCPPGRPVPTRGETRNACVPKGTNARVPRLGRLGQVANQLKDKQPNRTADHGCNRPLGFGSWAAIQRLPANLHSATERRSEQITDNNTSRRAYGPAYASACRSSPRFNNRLARDARLIGFRARTGNMRARVLMVVEPVAVGIRGTRTVDGRRCGAAWGVCH